MKTSTLLRALVPLALALGAGLAGMPAPARPADDQPVLVETLGAALAVRDYGAPAVRAKVADLARVPRPFLERLLHAGLKEVRIGDVPLPRLTGDPWYLDPANRPRGWGPDATWADVASIYDAGSKRIFAASAREGSVSNVLHEVGHAAGDLLAMNGHPAVVAAHGRCFGHLAGYYRQGGPGAAAGREEFLAEAFATYLKRGRDEAGRFADPAFVAYLDAAVTASP